MERPAKTESCILLIVIALIIFCWLSRFFNIALSSGANVFRTVIYPALLIFWCFTLHHRLIHKQIRHLAVSMGALMVFWFILRSIKYSLSPEYTEVIRYFWYSFYLPMLFIPTLALLTALAIGLPENQRLPRIYNGFWFIAAVLFLLVFTNDLHQLVFDFPDNVTPWTDKDYRYAIGYYAYAVYVAFCNIATFAILVIKCRHPQRSGRALLPSIPIFILLLYWILYIYHTKWLHYWFADLTAFSCVMYAAAFELSIRCGLIRSNSGYGEMFRAGGLRAQITNADHKVCLAGPDAAVLTENQMLDAEVGPLLINKTMLLKSRPIQFGHVLWQEDVSELMEAIEEYKENCRDLEEQSRLDRENLNAQKKMLSLQEKNRAGDLLHRETAAQLDLIDRLLTRYDSESADEILRRRLLAGAALVGAYIKRYGNLLLVSERSDEADTADLIRCFEESFLSLELLNVTCLCSLQAGQILKTKDMLHIYHTFESALELCMFALQHVWVNGREEEDKILVYIEFVSDTDLSELAPEADRFSADSGTCRFTFRAEKGGAGE